MIKIIKIFYLSVLLAFNYLTSQNYALLYDLNRGASAPNNIMYVMKNINDIRVKNAIDRLNKAILAVENKQDVKNAHDEIINLYKKYFHFSGVTWHMPIMNLEYNVILKPFENALKKIRELENKLSEMRATPYLESKYPDLRKAKQKFKEALAEAREKYKNDPEFLEEARSLREPKTTYHGYGVMPLGPNDIIDVENAWLMGHYPKAMKAQEKYDQLYFKITFDSPEVMNMEKQIKAAEAEYEKQVGIEEARKKLRVAVGKEFLDAQSEFEKIIEKVADELEKAEEERLSKVEELNEGPKVAGFSGLGGGFR